MAKTDLGRLPKIAVFVLIFFSNLFHPFTSQEHSVFLCLKMELKDFYFFFLNIHNFSTY